VIVLDFQIAIAQQALGDHEVVRLVTARQPRRQLPGDSGGNCGRRDGGGQGCVRWREHEPRTVAPSRRMQGQRERCRAQDRQKRERTGEQQADRRQRHRPPRQRRQKRWRSRPRRTPPPADSGNQQQRSERASDRQLRRHRDPDITSVGRHCQVTGRTPKRRQHDGGADRRPKEAHLEYDRFNASSFYVGG
jgi:hypothetical protein